MGGKVDGIESLQRIVCRSHDDVNIRSRAGKINKAVATSQVHTLRHFVVGRENACYIRAGSNGRYFERSVPVLFQQPVELRQVRQPLFIRRYNLHICNGFQPGCLVGVMFHMTYEHNRPLIGGDRHLPPESLVEFQPQNSLKFIDNACHAGVRSDEHICILCTAVSFNELTGMVVGGSHGAAGDASLGMRIAHEGGYLLHKKLLDRLIEPAAGRPVGINQRLSAVGCLK